MPSSANLVGIAQTALSGTGIGDALDILLRPTYERPPPMLTYLNPPAIDKQLEHGIPGYYRTVLKSRARSPGLTQRRLQRARARKWMQDKLMSLFAGLNANTADALGFIGDDIGDEPRDIISEDSVTGDWSINFEVVSTPRTALYQITGMTTNATKNSGVNAIPPPLNLLVDLETSLNGYDRHTYGYDCIQHLLFTY